MVSIVLALPLGMALAMGMSYSPWITYPAYSAIIGLLFAWKVPAWERDQTNRALILMVTPHVVFVMLVGLGWVILATARVQLGPALQPFLDSKLGWFIGLLIHVAIWYPLSYLKSSIQKGPN